LNTDNSCGVIGVELAHVHCLGMVLEAFSEEMIVSVTVNGRRNSARYVTTYLCKVTQSKRPDCFWKATFST